MKSLTRAAARLLLAAVACLATAGAHADGAVGDKLPTDFPVILDASLGEPLLGFGATGKPTRTPVVFVHGNNDTPFPTACNPYGRVQAFASSSDDGYAASELWAVGYQGDQCDLAPRPDHSLGSGPHDLGQRARRARFRARGASLHRRAPGRRRGAQPRVGDRARVAAPVSAGGSLRAALRRDIDGPNHGIINCSPNPLNYWQAPSLGGFTPASAVCQELGSPNTAFLKRLNKGQEAPGPGKDTLVIRNADTSFVYFAKQDGIWAPCLPRTRSGSPPTSRAARA